MTSQAENTLSIGEVLSMLKKDFSDVSISKIRFLETEGLITPSRTASGYRRFDTHDVARLRSILTLQRDQYLPLKVIKDQLDADQEQAGLAAPVATGVGVRPDDFRPGAGKIRLTRLELAHETSLSETLIAALEKDGLVWTSAAGHYDEDAVQICMIAAKLSEFGVEARHLRSFRVVANRESGLVEQIATPYSHPRDHDGKARAQQTVRELASLFVQLHAALLRAELIRSGSG
jgi:DNA-binding transcriptional MerR regulator